MFCGRAALEPARVDQYVEVESGERERRGQHVDEMREQPRGGGRQRDAKRQHRRAAMRPLGIGRSRVRAMCSSMSRSKYMLTALAPPAMR